MPITCHHKNALNQIPTAIDTRDMLDVIDSCLR